MDGNKAYCHLGPLPSEKKFSKLAERKKDIKKQELEWLCVFQHKYQKQNDKETMPLNFQRKMISNL